MSRVTELLYDGPKLVGILYQIPRPGTSPQKPIAWLKQLKTQPWFVDYPKRRIMLIGERAPSGPYNAALIAIYFRDRGLEFDFAVNNVQLLPDSIVHHTRSYKVYADGSYDFKFYDANIGLYLHLMGPKPDGLPLLAGRWPKRPNILDVYWYTTVEDANRLARKYGLAEHRQVLPEGPFVICTTYRDRKLLRIKYYYRYGYTADLFAHEPHLVWYQGRYRLYSLHDKRFLD